MNAADRPHDWTSTGRTMIGRLTAREFDTLELVDLAGGIVSANEIADRNSVTQEAACARMRRLVKVDLLVQIRIPDPGDPIVRRAFYHPTDIGTDLYREALAALDAAAEEAA